MSVIVDLSLCTGCGICIEACPEVFTYNADAKAEAIKQHCDLHILEEVADMCPTEAIEVST